jgi:hypothetical protein
VLVGSQEHWEQHGLQDGVGDVAATALAHNLKYLQHLDMRDCGIDLASGVFLAAAGQLKQLTCLCLLGNDELTEQGLMQLTGLSCLQQLYVDESEEVTEEVLDRFWAAVRRQ